jgi:hypothetical protein
MPPHTVPVIPAHVKPNLTMTPIFMKAYEKTTPVMSSTAVFYKAKEDCEKLGSNCFYVIIIAGESDNYYHLRNIRVVDKDAIESMVRLLVKNNRKKFYPMYKDDLYYLYDAKPALPTELEDMDLFKKLVYKF